jgi:cysteinyl-tRNA synthetase
VAQGKRFARHWVHNGWVMVGAEKMSKSLNNFTTIEELLKGADPRAYRLLVLRSQYRTQIEVTPGTIADAEKGLARLDGLVRRFSVREFSGLGAAGIGPVEESGGLADEVIDRFRARMDDNLDTPGALASIFDAVGRAHALADSGDEAAAVALAGVVALLCAVLGLALDARPTELDDEAAGLAAERDAARAAGDWARADALRDQLTERGFVVEDGPTGTTLRR